MTEKNLDILIYLLLAAFILLATFILIKKFLDNSYKLKILESKRNIQKDMLPLRLQAYERICLFLERISPNNLLVRVHQPGMSARAFQSALLMTIRSEYEHNLSQQLYISAQAWEHVKNAKEDVIRLINASAGSLNEKASGMELSKIILEIIIKKETSPVQHAINLVKHEAKQLF